MTLQRAGFTLVVLAAFTAGCTGTETISTVGIKTNSARAVTYGAPVKAPVQQVSPAGPKAILMSGEALGPSGSLVCNFELPKNSRGVQALPESTDKVTLSISHPKLASAIKQSLYRSQFVEGKATMIVEKMPLGEARVDCTIFDSSGALVTMGGATVVVREDVTTPVVLNLIVKEKSGAISIAVDTKTVVDTPVVVVPSAEPTSATMTLDSVSKSSIAPNWVNSGLKASKGQTFTITGSGRVGYNHYAPFAYDYHDASGCSGCGDGALSSALPSLALVGKFVSESGSISLFQIGSSRTFIAPSSGTISLGINSWKDSPWKWCYMGGSFKATINVH